MSTQGTGGIPSNDTGTSLSDTSDALASLLGGDDEVEEEDQPEPNPGSEDDAPLDAASEDDATQEGQPKAATPEPASWDAEAKAKFAKLPPDLQEYISAREQERERAVSTRLQEAAEVQRAVQARQAEIGQIRDAYEQRLVAFAHHLEATVPEKFKDIRSPTDLVRVAQTDPALAIEFNAWQSQVQSVAQEMERVSQERAADQERQFSAHRMAVAQREAEELSKVWPEYFTPEKGEAIRTGLINHALERGFSQEEVSSLVDHRLVLLLKDAQSWRQHAKSLETAKSKVMKPVPRVVKPGTGEASRGGVNRDAAIKIARSGDTRSIAAAMERLLSR